MCKNELLMLLSPKSLKQAHFILKLKHTASTITHWHNNFSKNLIFVNTQNILIPGKIHKYICAAFWVFANN